MPVECEAESIIAQTSPDATPGSITLTLGGESVLLLGSRALFWPARRRVVIADLHLGKSHLFRRAGIAVPQGATQDDLDRLTQIVAQTDARQVWIVGDVLHGPVHDAGWKAHWLRWRAQHRDLDIAAVVGNHDRALAGANLNIELLGEQCGDGPFLFAHVPHVDPGGRHVLAGHVHPVASVPGVPRRWPVFWAQPRQTVLPAYSAFTGGFAVRAGQGDRLVACVDGVALRVPTLSRAG